MAYNNQPDWVEMPKELKDWLIQNFKDCEDGKLTKEQKTLFLDLVEQNKDNKYFTDAFMEHQKNKLIN